MATTFPVAAHLSCQGRKCVTGPGENLPVCLPEPARVGPGNPWHKRQGSSDCRMPIAKISLIAGNLRGDHQGGAVAVSGSRRRLLLTDPVLAVASVVLTCRRGMGSPVARSTQA